MTSSSKDRYFANVAKSRRSSPGEPQGNHNMFFQTGQVPQSYSNPYTQPRSAPNKIGYDLNPQAFYSPYQSTGTTPQFQPPFSNYEIHHERYSPQPSYPTYSSRSPQPIIHNPPDSRRLPPLTTSSPPLERWQQPSFVQPATGFPGNSFRSPTASYPPTYMAYSTNPANAYSYHIPTQDHASSINQPSHAAMYDEVARLDPRSASPYSRSGTSHVSPPPPRVYTPPPISPVSPEEPTIKKKRKRADAAQLKVLNETYNRTAFPSTEERIALAKMLDMSARSVQIWFQNKRQSMRQTNRQSSTVGSSSHHPFTMTGTDPISDDLIPQSSSGFDTGPLGEPLYLTGSSQDVSTNRSLTSQSHSHSQHHHHHHHHSSHRHPRDPEDDLRKWSRPL